MKTGISETVTATDTVNARINARGIMAYFIFEVVSDFSTTEVGEGASLCSF